jgi:hypothetical protein
MSVQIFINLIAFIAYGKCLIKLLLEDGCLFLRFALSFILGLFVLIRSRTNQTEENWEEDKAVVKAKYDDQEKDLKFDSDYKILSFHVWIGLN